MHSWTFTFDIEAGAEAFAIFRRTGVFRYKIGKTPIQSELTAGLEAIARFQDACRRG